MKKILNTKILNTEVFTKYNIFLFLIPIISDQTTKRMALAGLFENLNIDNKLSFEVSINRGISCGFFHSQNQLYFLGVSFLILCVLFFLLFHMYTQLKDGLSISYEILILSGAVSNFIDRIFYSGVIDFIGISFFGWSFYSFNIADACIVSGVMLMLFNKNKS